MKRILGISLVLGLCGALLVTAPPHLTVRAEAPTAGLIAYYPMDEAQGTTAHNAVTNTNHAELIGATWAEGKEGGALAFGRTSTTPSSAPYAIANGPFNLSSNEVTFAAWIYANGGDMASDWQAIMSDPQCCNYRLMLQPGGTPYNSTGTHNGWIIGNVTVSPNTWQHVAMTIKGGVSAQYFLNGQMVSSTVSGVPAVLPNMTSLVLGSGERTSGWFYSMNGRLDEVRIYNRRLTPAEIAQLADPGSPQPTATLTPAPTETPPPNPLPERFSDGLLAHYPMNEATGLMARNAVTNTRHAQLANATWADGWQRGGLAFGRPPASPSSAPFALASGPFQLTANEVTFATWIYFNQGDMATNWQAIMSDPQCCNYRIMLYPGGKPYMGTGIHADWLLQDVTVEANKWQHIALTIKGGATAKFYLNGVLKATRSEYVPTVLPHLNALALGSGERNSGWFYSLDGRLDEVRVYGRVLPAEDIALLAAQNPDAPAPTPTPSPTPSPTPTPSNCTISINDGDTHTRSRQVMVNAVVANAASMRLANDGGLTNASLLTFTQTVSWTLADPGRRIATVLVYARFYDAQGNPLCGGASVIDDIVYDPIAPSLVVKPISPITSTTPVSVAIEIEVLDQEGGSGIGQIMVSPDQNFSGASWQDHAQQVWISARKGDRVFVRAADAAGNVSTTGSANVSLSRDVYLPVLRSR
jgi:hypothetical protein